MADVINIPARENNLLPLLLQLQHSRYEDQLSQARLAMLPLQAQQQAIELQIRQRALDESLDPNSPHNRLLDAQTRAQQSQTAYFGQEREQSKAGFETKQKEAGAKARTAEAEALRSEGLSTPEAIANALENVRSETESRKASAARAYAEIENQQRMYGLAHQEQDLKAQETAARLALTGPTGAQMARNMGTAPGASPALANFSSNIPQNIDFPTLHAARASLASTLIRSNDPNEQMRGIEMTNEMAGGRDPYGFTNQPGQPNYSQQILGSLRAYVGGGGSASPTEAGPFGGPPTPGSVPTSAGVQPPSSTIKGPFSGLPYHPELKASPVVDKLAGSLEGFGSLGSTPLGSIQEIASGDGPAAKKAKEFLSVKGSMFRDESQEGFIARMTKISGGTDKAKAIERFYTEDRAASGTSHTLYKGLLTDLFQSKTDEERAKAVEDLKAKYGNQALTPTQWGSLKSMSGFMGWEI